MASPAKPPSRHSKPAPAIFADPAATEPALSAKVIVPESSAVAMTAMVDPVAVEAAIDHIAVPAIAPAHPHADAAPLADATDDLPERNVETVPAHLIDTVSVLPKGPFSMATAFDMNKSNDMMGEMNSRAKGAMEKGVKFAEEMTDFTKGNVEAIVASGRVAAKGIETMAQEAAETAKSGFEQAQTAMKSFTQVKSPTELFQLQSDFAKTAFDQLVANASKASEHMMKLMGDVAQPLSNRYAIASEKVKSASL